MHSAIRQSLVCGWSHINVQKIPPVGHFRDFILSTGLQLLQGHALLCLLWLISQQEVDRMASNH